MAKKILICGAGSIGVYLGTLLYSKGNNVTLFGRRKLKKVEGNEIFIDGKKFRVPEKIFEIPHKEKYDFVFLTTKLYDTDYMVRVLKKSGIKAALIVSIQNGLVNMSKYSKSLNKKIIPVTVFSGLNLSGNKLHVSPTKVGWITENSTNGKKVSNLISSSGIKCNASKDFNSLRAEKTIVNCCLNVLSAIENKPFSELFHNNKTRERIESLFYECYNILSKEYKLDNVEKMKKRMIKHWAKLKHYSSTCQDLHSGRPTEARFFNGYMVELGLKHKLPVENNKKIMKEINQLEK